PATLTHPSLRLGPVAITVDALLLVAAAAEAARRQHHAKQQQCQQSSHGHPPTVEVERAGRANTTGSRSQLRISSKGPVHGPVFPVAPPPALGVGLEGPQPTLTASRPATMRSAISFFTTIVLSVEK